MLGKLLGSCTTNTKEEDDNTHDTSYRISKRDFSLLKQWYQLNQQNIPLTMVDFPKHIVPRMAVTQMYILHIQSVTKWPLPQALVTPKCSNNISIQKKYITYSISISFYHTVSKRFFGATWKGMEKPCSDDSDNGEIVMLNEVVLFHSKTIDSSCIAIIELIATEKYSTNNTLSRHISCGWAMIQPFGRGNTLTDLQSIDNNSSEDDDAIPLSSLKVYRGTPRKLVLLNQMDFNDLSEGMSPYPGCKINYRLVTNSKMNNEISSIIRENSIISVDDNMVAGLEFKNTRDYNEKRNITDIVVKNDKLLLKNLRSLKLSDNTFQIKIKNISVKIPNRILFESKLCDTLNGTIPKEEVYEKRSSLFGMSTKLVKQDISVDNKEEKKAKAKVINRKLKVGVHNGNTLRSKNWKEVELESSDMDKNEIVCLQDTVAVVDGIVMHRFCAVLFVLEFMVKPSQTVIRNHTAEARKGSSSTADLFSVIVGFQIFLPFDGEKVKNLQSTQLSLMNNGSIRIFSNDRLYSCDDTIENNDIQLTFDIVDTKVAKRNLSNGRIKMRSFRSIKKDGRERKITEQILPSNKNLKHDSDESLNKECEKSVSIKTSNSYTDEDLTKNHEDESLKERDLLLKSIYNKSNDFLARPLHDVYEELEEDLEYARAVGRDMKQISIHDNKHDSERLQNFAAISSHCSKVGEKTPVEKRCEVLTHILSTKEVNVHEDQAALELEYMKWFREGEKRNMIKDHIKKHKDQKKDSFEK